jgi:M6 family metalloprotease-like protein
LRLETRAVLARAVGTLLASLVIAGAPAGAGAGAPLKVRPVARPEDVARFERLGLPAPAAARPEELRIQAERERRWRSIRDVLSAPGVDWSSRAQRRAGWRPPAGTPRHPRTATAAAPAETPAETLKVAFILIDFQADRGGDASTGDGRFDLSGPDTSVVPIDPPPHDQAFFQSHAQALARYYDAQSYGRVVLTGVDTTLGGLGGAGGDVWPARGRRAYSLSDMADYGPWAFSQEIYRAAVRLFRDMLFAADSQSVALGDPIPWDAYDRYVLIHAGSDLQSDVRQNSKEDIPSFTLTVGDSDVVIFRDSTNRPIDRVSIIPETNTQDDYYGAINGVLAHESGHNFFGLYDLYNVLTGLPVVGYWSLMDSGNLVGVRVPFGRDTLFATGLLPPSTDPWQRFFLGDALAFPEVAYDGSSTALANSERNPEVRRVTLSSDEYLLLENRYLAPAEIVLLDQDSLTRVILGPRDPDRFEYDALLPGTGILVWHIDESVIPFLTSMRVNADTSFNTDPDRYSISIIEGDGLQDLGDTGSPYLLGAPFDPWFLDNNPVLSDSTFPNLIPHIGTRPHKRIAFLDDPAPVMHFEARRTWELPGWPVAADFPPGGPLLLAVDANGDRNLEVCWAGGRDSLEVLVGGRTQRVANPDSAALFAVRPDGLGLDSSRVYAFAHLDRRPMPEMAALPIGESQMEGYPAYGPAYFAVSTYAAGPDTSSPGGRVWLIDHQGQPLPGWPPLLPSIVTTPPVIAGQYPNAMVFVGCADGRVYGLGLDGTVAISEGVRGPVVGRLAVATLGSSSGFLVAAGSVGGWVTPFYTTQASHCDSCPSLDQHVSTSDAFSPDFLWIFFDGRQALTASATSAPAGGGCEYGRPVLVVHDGDRLWAFCPDGARLPGWGHSFGDTIIAGLGAGDPDGDGFPKVLFQTVRSGLAFVNRTGYPTPGWPKPGTTESFRTASPPLALDVDGDGKSEVVGMNASGIVAAIRADGRTPEGWPLATGSGATGSPVAADLNRDGALDLVAPDRFGLLYAYSLPVGLGDLVANSWTMLGGDPGRTSALPSVATPVAPAPSAGPLASGSLVAYPNPARRHPVSFAFRLTEPAEVEFRILDTSGHQVASFSRSGLQGENVQVWEPGSLPAGLYLARLRFQGAATEHVAVVQVGLLR